MNVIRMIKMFGWEQRVEKQVNAKREQELSFVTKKRLFGLINQNVKCVSSPLLSRISTSSKAMIDGLTLNQSYPPFAGVDDNLRYICKSGFSFL